jgi:iron(III) transport system ATP-binding protein
LTSSFFWDLIYFDSCRLDGGRFMAEVRLAGVGKHYDKHKVYEDLNLTVRDGECFTLLGPSGCGKTVTVRLIAGFEPPTFGDLFIGKTLVSSAAKKIHLPPESRNIGIVFQDYAVWPHKTAFENVIYPLTIQRIQKNEAATRAQSALEQVNLRTLENRLPYQLSGGQQQRVALARALVSKPEVMLLDEPLSNLDANLREEMRFEIKALQKSTGVTIFYVTHDQEIALAISDRVAIMDRNGHVRQIGAPDEIYENPADAFVFKFMGVSNFIPVELRNNRVYVKESDIPLEGASLPEGERKRKGFIAGCRPSDIDLSRNETGTKGVVKRMVFLGSIIDYRIEMGGREIRVQQDTQEALSRNLVFSEGETCGFKFHDLKWFDLDQVEEEIAS